MGKPWRTASATPLLVPRRQQALRERLRRRVVARRPWPRRRRRAAPAGGQHLVGLGPVELLVEAQLGRVRHVRQHELGRGRRCGRPARPAPPWAGGRPRARAPALPRAGEEPARARRRRGGPGARARGRSRSRPGAGRSPSWRAGAATRCGGACAIGAASAQGEGRVQARTARSTSLSATMHEIRMVEVEIISMLIPSSARVSNMVAAIPGCDFIPAPTSDTRAMSASAVTPVAPSSSAWACDVSTATARSVVGHGEGDVGRPVRPRCSARSCRR